MTHDGQSNFIVRLLDSRGERLSSLTNEIGPFNGSKAIRIEESGSYVLDISADGIWSVNLTQPAPVAEVSLPLTLTGEGQQASELFRLEAGLTTFKMTHDGQSNFIVRLLDSRGERLSSLTNEIGPFDGSKAVGIKEAGVYILDISADGNWTISIEQ